MDAVTRTAKRKGGEILKDIVYISGPITSATDYMQAFISAESELLDKYENVVNPAVMCSELPKLDHEDYMKICIAALSVCNKIYLLKGWEESKGACEEVQYALEHDIQIIVQ